MMRRNGATFALFSVGEMGYWTLLFRFSAVLRNAVVMCSPLITPDNCWHKTTWPEFQPSLPPGQVLVFKSADPDYFISHVDVTRITEYREEAAKLTGEAPIALLFPHLSASRLVTIAQIEGRVRGAGSEFVLACDMRFAARESAIFSQ